MKHRIMAALAACGLAFLSSPAAAQADCTRGELDELAQGWIDAVESGDAFRMQLSEWVDYRENFKIGTLSSLLTRPRKVDWSLKLLDTTQCKVFVETVITDPEHPMVMATQIDRSFSGGTGQIRNIVTDEGDWLFSARNTLKYASAENWQPLPEGARATREQLIAAANAYLDLFADPTVQVPWGAPCARLEGGAYTGKGLPSDSCNIGVPAGIKLTERKYVVDEEMGAVDVFLKFGDNKLPDSHMFRVEDGKLRYVHTVTNCGDKVNCGFPPFDPDAG